MKKTTIMALALTVFIGAQLLTPNKSEAQITCSTDFYGNTRCVDSYSGNSSNTRTDPLLSKIISREPYSIKISFVSKFDNEEN